jgi:hypothetical protein
MDALLTSHRIDAQALRRDDFEGFYEARKSALLELIKNAMGKVPEQWAEVEVDADEDETVEQS